MGYEARVRGELCFSSVEALETALALVRTPFSDSVLSHADFRREHRMLGVDWGGVVPASLWSSTLDTLFAMADGASSGEVETRFEGEAPSWVAGSARAPRADAGPVFPSDWRPSPAPTVAPGERPYHWKEATVLVVYALPAQMAEPTPETPSFVVGPEPEEPGGLGTAAPEAMEHSAFQLERALHRMIAGGRAELEPLLDWVQRGGSWFLGIHEPPWLAGRGTARPLYFEWELQEAKRRKAARAVAAEPARKPEPPRKTPVRTVPVLDRVTVDAEGRSTAHVRSELRVGAVGEALSELAAPMGVGTEPLQRLLAAWGRTLTAPRGWAFFPHGRVAIDAATPALALDPAVTARRLEGADTFFGQAVQTQLERARSLASGATDGRVELAVEGRRAATAHPTVTVARRSAESWIDARARLVAVGVSDGVLDSLQQRLASLRAHRVEGLGVSLAGSGLGGFDVSSTASSAAALALAVRLGVDAEVCGVIESIAPSNVRVSLPVDEYLAHDELTLELPLEDATIVPRLLTRLLSTTAGQELSAIRQARGEPSALRLVLRAHGLPEVGVAFRIG